MDRNPLATPLVMMVTAAILIPVALCPFWLPTLPSEGFWVARGLAVTGGMAVLTVIGHEKDARARLPLVLASPAVTLPLLALVFYSVIPAIYVELNFGGPIAVPPGALSEDLHKPFGLYAAYAAASLAETWVLAFSGIGLLLAMVFDRLIAAHPDRDTHRPYLIWGLVLVCSAGGAFQLGKTYFPSSWASSLVDSLPPLVMFGMALLTGECAAHPIRRGTWVVAGLAVGLALLFPYQIKAFVFFFVALLLTISLRSRGWTRIAVVGTLLATPALGAGVVMLPRGIAPNLAGKIVYRQSETVFCLDFALREAAAGGGEWRTGPFYFTAGLIPRALWPDKPSLSHGDAFGRFCGLDIPGHSASITLLGEPALRGGPWGIAIAGLVLASLSAAMIATWKRGGRISTALALALTPWLIDFDQHFAMYVANLTRAFLAALPVALVLRHFTRRQNGLSAPS